LVDRPSTSSEPTIRAAARALEKNDVRVIPVGFGREMDAKQLLMTTPEKDNLVQATKDDKPDNVGKKILEIVLKGKMDLNG